ncbi:Methionine aminopeptidase 1 [Listeria grayi]|uniref:Methionine aminopeptidase 1 n=1 Tax=Listeria grayi TaxID=1641 RepID=A0A378M9H1_LISGR|nr:Methionine aminopeptidase 1 [Listeria grayi]
MITLKSRREIDEMKKAGDILVATHKEIKKLIKPGITSWDLEVFADEFIRKHDAIPEQKDLKVTNMPFVQVSMMRSATVSRGRRN